MIDFKKYSRGLLSAAFLLFFIQGVFGQSSLIPRDSAKLVLSEKSAKRMHFYGPFVYDDISITPFPLWNNYNKTIIGIAIQNRTCKPKNFEYFAAPMLSMNPVSFAFDGYVQYMQPLESKRIESITYKADFRRYAYSFDLKARNWNRFSAQTIFTFTHNKKQPSLRPQFYIRNIFNAIEATEQFQSAFGEKILSNNINEFAFYLNNPRKKHPYQLWLNLEFIQEFGKFSKPHVFAGTAGKLSLTYKQRINYFSTKKGFDIRFFAGTFLGKSKTILDYRYRMSAYAGYQDYKFDYYYFGRAEARGIMSQQFYESDGNFKVLTPIGQTNRWLMALNLKASLPGPIPIKPFFDMGIHRDIITIANTGEQIKSVKFNYSGGIMLSVINDVFEIYFPIFHSKDIKNYLAFNQLKWYNQIRFNINLLELKPKRIREKIEWLPNR